ncbi:MAG: chemotaxis protein CheW [Gudongella sp.]|jgi:purine-binding chemotaxis protein CheW|nr:chemotaxis protein CheW [Gudongella sp.]
MEQFLIFIAGGQKFALGIKSISKIIEYLEPQKIPEVSDFVQGVIPYNDSVLPVISLSNRLYGVKENATKDNRVIIAIWKEKEIGFIVEDIDGIRAIQDEEIELSNKDFKISKDYIMGYIKRGKDIVVILDINKIFTLEHELELLELNEMLEDEEIVEEK